jgi:hypothetical protein
MSPSQRERREESYPKACGRREHGYRSVGITIAILTCVAGCGAFREADEPDDVVESQTQLISDPTGLITVSITQCAAVSAPNGGVLAVGCPVDPKFVLVGGGGQVVGEPEPGALLQMSRPNRSSWVVQAKDHVHPGPFQLQAAAIGLQLTGVSQADLASMVTVTRVNSGTPATRQL